MSLLSCYCVRCCIAAAGRRPLCSFSTELLGVTSRGRASRQLTGTMEGFAQRQELTWVWARPWSLWVQGGALAVGREVGRCRVLRSGAGSLAQTGRVGGWPRGG